MPTDRTGGIALIVGSVGGFVTMGLHPTGGSPERVVDLAGLAIGVHALGITSLWIQLLGFWRLSRAMNLDRLLPQAALLAYAFAAGAAVIAATASGFLTPAVAERALDDDPMQQLVWRSLMQNAYLLNQSLDKVWVFGTIAAVMLWSIVGIRTGGGWKILGLAGVILAAFGAIAFGSGHLRTDVHGAFIFVVGIVAWSVAAGALMMVRAKG